MTAQVEAPPTLPVDGQRTVSSEVIGRLGAAQGRDIPLGEAIVLALTGVTAIVVAVGALRRLYGEKGS